MANEKYDWLGDAVAVAQVDLITLVANAALETTDNLTGTVNGKSSTTAAGSTNVDTASTNFAAGWNASTIGEHEEITAAAAGAGGVTNMTGDTAGKSFTLTATTTETGGGASDGQTFTRSASVAVDGPKVWSANNFKDLAAGTRGALPGAAATQQVFIQAKSGDILYSLDQSGIANALAVLNIAKSFTGKIGLPRTNIDNANKPYDEYRTRYLKIKASHARIGYGEGDGSGRINLDFGSTACKCYVYGSGSRIDSYPSTLLLGSAAANELYITGDADVGIALDEGETATWDEIYVSENAEVRIGPGVTLGKLNVGDNATAWVNWRTAGLSALYITGNGTVYLYGGLNTTAASALTMDDIYVRSKGTLYLNTEAGTTANLFVGASATVDTRQGPSKMSASVTNVFTVTNLATAMAGNQNDGVTKIYDPGKRIFWQAGLQLDGMQRGFDLDLGTPVKMVVGGGSLS